MVILRSCRELIDPKLKAQLVSPYTMVKLARKSRCRSVNVSIVRIVYQLNLPLIVTMTMGTLIWSVLPHHDILVWRALRGPYNWARIIIRPVILLDGRCQELKYELSGRLFGYKEKSIIIR